LSANSRDSVSRAEWTVVIVSPNNEIFDLSRFEARTSG